MQGTHTIAAFVMALTIVAAGAGCTSGGGSASGCTTVEVASSPEKIDLLTNLAGAFNQSKEAKTSADGGCGTLHVDNVSSGAAEQQLADGWPSSETTVPKPIIWTPAA